MLDNVKVSLDYKPSYTLIESLLMLPRRWKGERKTKEEAMECLEVVGLAHLAEEKPSNLPYGMQRRLEIARAAGVRAKSTFAG